MPDTEPATIHDLFRSESSEAAAAIPLESNAELSELRELVAKEVSALAANGLGDALIEGLQETFDLPFATLLGTAWATYEKLLPYADPAVHPPDEIALVPLGSHTITSTHRPKVEVHLDGKKIRTVTFELDLSLELEACVLKIRGGRILEAQGARARGALRFACMGAVLAESQSRRISLPAKLVFEGGIWIAPAPR